MFGPHRVARRGCLGWRGTLCYGFAVFARRDHVLGDNTGVMMMMMIFDAGCFAVVWWEMDLCFFLFFFAMKSMKI